MFGQREHKNFIEYKNIIHELKSGDLIEIEKPNEMNIWVIFEGLDENKNAMCYYIKPNKDVQMARSANIVYESLSDIMELNRDKYGFSKKLTHCRIDNQELLANKLIKIGIKNKPDINQMFLNCKAFLNRLVEYNFMVFYLQMIYNLKLLLILLNILLI
jgi:hypothetical protein